jgi:hypothetical protein
MATTKSKAKTPKGGSVSGVHILKEDNPWAIDYAGHEPRRQPALCEVEKDPHGIAKSTTANAGPAWFYGPDPWEDHHGGGLWVHDGNG